MNLNTNWCNIQPQMYYHNPNYPQMHNGIYYQQPYHNYEQNMGNYANYAYN